MARIIPIEIRLKRRIKLLWCEKLNDWCWLYEAATGHHPGLEGGSGYIQIEIRASERYKYGGARFPMVHRVAYIVWVGPLDNETTIDHLCSRRNCIKPNHLDPVTMAENLRRSDHAPSTINSRKSTCPRDHLLSGDNLYVDNTGRRHCRKCRAQKVLEYDIRHREQRRIKAQERRNKTNGKAKQQ